MKARSRRWDRGWVGPGNVSWDFLPPIEPSFVSQPHGGERYTDIKITDDVTSKKRGGIAKRLPNTGFTSDHYTWSRGARQGYNGPTIGGTVKAEFPHSYLGSNTVFSVPGFHPGAPNEHYAHKLVAQTQPFRRGSFSITVQIRELIELATLFQFGGHSFLNFAGNSYLNFKFGWESFLRDINAVNGIFKDHQLRVKELLRLAEKGLNVRKNVHLFSKSDTYVSNPFPIMSFPYPAWAMGITRSKVKHSVRGSIRWGLAPGAWRFFEELEAEGSIWTLAMEKLVGFEAPSPQDIWNIIPFSWLIDYFLKIDDWLASMYDRNLFIPEEASITSLTEWEGSIEPTGPVTGFISPISGKRRRIHRVIIDPTLSRPPVISGLDLLSVDKWAVIAALLTNYKVPPKVPSGPR